MNVRLLGEPAEHNSDHRNVNPSFGMRSFGFIVSHQTTMFHQPAEGSFNDPTLGQHAEARPAPVPLDDLQPQRTRFAMGGHPGGEVRSGVTLIGPQATQPAEAGQRLPQKAAGTVPLRYIGFGNTDPEEQPQRIHLDMTFDPLGFLGCIVASLASLIGGAYGLTVQDSSRGLRAFPGGFADGLAQQIVDNFPAALLSPEPEIMVNRLPRAKVSGQQPLSATGAHEIEQSAADAAQVRRWTTPAFAGLAGWQGQLQQIPLFISQIRWIQSSISHPAILKTPLGHPLSKDSKRSKNDFSDTLLEKTVVESQQRQSSRGQVFGLIIALTGLCLATFAAMRGQAAFGSI